MTAVFDALFNPTTGLFVLMLNFVMNILTPPTAGPTGFQIIVYAGFCVGFIGAAIGWLKSLAKG